MFSLEPTEESEVETSYYANDYMYEREEEEVEGSESPEAAITEPAAAFSQERLAAAAAALAFRPRRPRRRSVPIDPADI